MKIFIIIFYLAQSYTVRCLNFISSKEKFYLDPEFGDQAQCALNSLEEMIFREGFLGEICNIQNTH